MSQVGFCHFTIAHSNEQVGLFFVCAVARELSVLTRPQSKDAVQLYALLVDETYGELASVGSHATFLLSSKVQADKKCSSCWAGLMELVRLVQV